MGSAREDRLAKNEALFRTGNERMAKWPERHDDDPVEHYLCECADPACLQTIALHRNEYEAVRQDSRHFVVLAGHEIADIEKVVDRHGAWSVVEKNPEVAAVVEATDPRRH